MSLLRDALQRRQEEGVPLPSEPREGTVPEKGKNAEAPTLPPPIPAGGTARDREHGREWVAITVVLGGFFVMLMLIAILLWMLWSSFSQGPREDVSIAADEVAVVTSIPAETSANGEPTGEVDTPQPVDLEPMDVPIKPVEAAVDDAAPPPSVIVDPSGPVIGVESPVPVGQETIDDAGGEWPEIRITAAFQRGEAGGTVLIDGEILHVGESYQGAVIEAITPRGVVMRFAGEERVIPVRR